MASTQSVLRIRRLNLTCCLLVASAEPSVPPGRRSGSRFARLQLARSGKRHAFRLPAGSTRTTPRPRRREPEPPACAIVRRVPRCALTCVCVNPLNVSRLTASGPDRRRHGPRGRRFLAPIRPSPDSGRFSAARRASPRPVRAVTLTRCPVTIRNWETEFEPRRRVPRARVVAPRPTDV